MNCTRARFLVYAYFDREIPRPEGEALERTSGFAGRAPPGTGRPAASASCFGRGSTTPAAPIGLRERLNASVTARIRPRYAPLGIAASILLLILPLVADQSGPESAALSLAGRWGGGRAASGWCPCPGR